MMKINKRQNFTAPILFLLSGLAFWVALLEFKVINGSQSLAFSTKSDHIILQNCLAKLTRPATRLSPDLESRISQNCIDRSEKILASSPMLAFGWYVLAYSNDIQNDETGFNAALEMAYLYGSSESWLAALRFELAQNTFANLTQTNRLNHLNDLELLLNSPRELPRIVNRYIYDPDLRPRVVAVLPNLSGGNQNRFLTTLRQKMMALRNE